MTAPSPDPPDNLSDRRAAVLVEASRYLQLDAEVTAALEVAIGRHPAGKHRDPPGEVFRLDHLDAAWAYSSIANARRAVQAHTRCEIGVCATLTAATLKLRSAALHQQ